MKKQYKPILVFYFKCLDFDKLELIKDQLKKVKENTGYEILIVEITDGDERVEIISVDKPTVVEDIQKYLDDKIVKNEE